MNNDNKTMDALKGKNAGAFPDIPEGYFDTLADKTLGNIDKFQNRKKRNYIYWSIAASLALIVSLSVVLFRMDHNKLNTTVAENNTTAVVSTDTLKDRANEKIISPNDSINESDDEDVDFDALFEEVPLDAILDYLNEMDEFEF
jgi:hypothetical protein